SGAEARFKAVKGSASEAVLPARAQFMHLMGLLAGKWPHSLALQAGGTTRPVEVQEKNRILAILFAFRRFLEKTLFGDALENVINIDCVASLESWADKSASSSSDFKHFLSIARVLNLVELGRAGEDFLSFGAYPDEGGELFAKGVWDGVSSQFDESLISEDISHSWMLHQADAKHPFDGVTLPSDGQDDGYSWCKAPRLDGRVMEVGALARQQVQGHPLIRDLVRQSGANVRNRVIARLLEIALVVVQMEQWAKCLIPGAAFCNQARMPDDAQGFGMVEAARGSLGHWLKVKNGRILNYQIIAPTTWNFSPRDSLGKPGALEQALVNAPVRDGETEPISVQHIVRSFDPCMVCTVH
ncbi:MAG: nickel-dependent hydrogenase large subunit, partial [Desulfobacterales bacterium]|nr:nickel-dependent hydrogenase large subunit [Desulfobacterales bacterium]